MSNSYTMNLIEIMSNGTGYSNNLERADRGDMEKLLAMLTLGLGSLLAGMLPAIISERNRRRFPLITSLFLCFGAGVLFATALVHILPEVRKQMSEFAEVAMCGGFFVIYFVDEFIHYFFGEAIQHQHPPTHHSHTADVNATGATIPSVTRNGYGAIDEHAPLLTAPTTSNSLMDQNTSCHEHAAIPGCDDDRVEDANARICHTSHTEPCAQSMMGTLGLFVALSVHSAIEGLTIGVQNSASKVLFLLGAVACHKFVMGFCLGLEFRSSPQASLRSQFIGISVFALGAVCGIALGMLVVDLPAGWSQTTLPIIQALAGGTLFYVTVCEVIPREKARWHQNRERRAAGFAQFFAVVVGFTTICIINFYLRDDD